MTEHERLKRICDEIGYEYNDYPKNNIKKDIYFIEWSFKEFYWRYLNVRELIFTPEFMEKYCVALWKTNYQKMILENYNERAYLSFFRNELLLNLHDPVGFLDNLLFNK